MKITCEARGVEAVVRGIGKYDAETHDKVAKAVNRSLNAIRRKAKARIHNVTGNLRRGIKKNFDKRVISGTVRSTAPHAHLVEFGTKGKGVVKPRRAKAFRLPNGYMAKSFVHKGMKERPYIRPAFAEQEPKYISDMKKAVKPK